MAKKKFNLSEFSETVNRGSGITGTPEQKESTASAPAPVTVVVQKSALKKSGTAGYKMVNIRFTQDNADYLRKEAAVRGMNMTSFVNWLVDEYKSNPEHVHDYSLME